MFIICLTIDLNISVYESTIYREYQSYVVRVGIWKSVLRLHARMPSFSENFATANCQIRRMLQLDDKPVYRKISLRNRISYSQACHAEIGAVEVDNNIHSSSICLLARLRRIVPGYRSPRKRSAQYK